MQGAGGVAAAGTTPMDVVKTRLQTQGVVKGQTPVYTSAFSAVSRVYAEEGVAAFGRGMLPRLALHIPASAISWTTYELVKGFLST